jgi:hypothetical protein
VALTSTQGVFEVLKRYLARATTLVRTWSRRRAKLDKELKSKKRNELVALRGRLHTDPTDFKAQAELVIAEAALEELKLIVGNAHQAQESMQAAWISDGDQCSKIFFSILKSRSAVNSIHTSTGRPC